MAKTDDTTPLSDDEAKTLAELQARQAASVTAEAAKAAAEQAAKLKPLRDLLSANAQPLLDGFDTLIPTFASTDLDTMQAIVHAKICLAALVLRAG